MDMKQFFPTGNEVAAPVERTIILMRTPIFAVDEEGLNPELTYEGQNVARGVPQALSELRVTPQVILSQGEGVYGQTQNIIQRAYYDDGYELQAMSRHYLGSEGQIRPADVLMEDMAQLPADCHTILIVADGQRFYQYAGVMMNPKDADQLIVFSEPGTVVALKGVGEDWRSLERVMEIDHMIKPEDLRKHGEVRRTAELDAMDLTRR